MDSNDPTKANRLRARAAWLARLLLRLAVVLCIAWAAHFLIQWSDARIAAARAGAGLRGAVLGGLILTYAGLIAIPFVPGVELGLALMMFEGPSLAPIIYAATVVGLIAAYLAGAWLPEARLRTTLEDLHLRRAADLIAGIAPLSKEQRLARMQEILPGRVPAWLVRYRYIALALLVNLPGNSVLGGGGGILLLAGFSRLFGFGATLLTMLIAVLPVPLAIWLSSF